MLYIIYLFTGRGYKVCKINQMTIKTIGDRCNRTYGEYLNHPMHAVERKITMNIAKNLQLINSLDRTKQSHKPFNN